MRNTPLLLLLLFQSLPAFAYVGPGTGLSAIGTILAFLGSILLLIVGFLWYPIKRLIKSRKNQETEEETAEADNTAPKDNDQ